MARFIRLSITVSVTIILLIPVATNAAWPTDPAVNVPLTEALRDQVDHKICPDGFGGAIVAWADYRATVSTYKIDVYAQRVSLDGNVRWVVDGTPVCTLDTWSRDPVLASDGQGGAIIAWVDWRSGRDIYAQRLDSQGNLQWAANGIPVCAQASYQTWPTIIADTAGGAFVAWVDERLAYRAIFVQHLDSSGSPLWAVDGVAATATPRGQEHPRLVLDVSGGVIVVWHDQRLGTTEKDIYAQRLNSAGIPLWASEGVPLTMATAQQVRPEAVSDGAGGVIVAWEDQRAYPPDHIYAQRVNGSGTVLWTADGVPVCTHADATEPPVICSDGAGGAIIAWMDSRAVYPPTNSEIYAQRLDNDGIPQWTIDGELIGTGDYGRGNPSIVSDGTGGAMIAWHDNRRYSIYDVYAQRVDGNGVSQWTPNGELVSLGQSATPVLVRSVSGSAVVVWQDGSYYPDIHAQNVPLGNVSGVSDGEGLCDMPAIRNVGLIGYPNPFNPHTRLKFSLAQDGRITLKVYNQGGRLVSIVIDDFRSAGMHEEIWDGRDLFGRAVGSGVYYARLITNVGAVTTKLMLLK